MTGSGVRSPDDGLLPGTEAAAWWLPGQRWGRDGKMGGGTERKGRNKKKPQREEVKKPDEGWEHEGRMKEREKENKIFMQIQKKGDTQGNEENTPKKEKLRRYFVFSC